MKFCYDTSFTLPKQPKRSRSVLYDGTIFLGSFGRKKKAPSYNLRNTVKPLKTLHDFVTVFKKAYKSSSKSLQEFFIVCTSFEVSN